MGDDPLFFRARFNNTSKLLSILKLDQIDPSERIDVSFRIFLGSCSSGEECYADKHCESH